MTERPLPESEQCELCDGEGMFVVPAGALGNLSNFQDTEKPCSACAGDGVIWL